jgi:hypothetical protein
MAPATCTTRCSIEAVRTGSSSDRAGLEELNIYAVIGYRTPSHRDGYFYKHEYRYDEKLYVYICHNGQLLSCRTTNREGYKQYHSDPDQYSNCTKYTQSGYATEVMTRHVGVRILPFTE